MLGGNPPRTLLDRSQDLDAVPRALRITRDASRGDALSGATELVTRRLLASRLSRRRLVVISDFARGTSASAAYPRGATAATPRVALHSERWSAAWPRVGEISGRIDPAPGTAHA